MTNHKTHIQLTQKIGHINGAIAKKKKRKTPFSSVVFAWFAAGFPPPHWGGYRPVPMVERA
jgi:hypothetical protein